MRVADYITSKIYEAGGEHVFLLTGGMIMHLTDALRSHPSQKFVCCHHEQAAAMAAEAYGRFTGKLGAAYVTAGPGALNTLTGVVGAYVDSSPCIIVAGQSKLEQAIVKGPRQFALQGMQTLELYKQFTKYAVMITDPLRARYEVEKCIAIAKTPRSGPVWLECPVDIQGMQMDPDAQEGYVPEDAIAPTKIQRAQVAEVADLIKKSRRPCILAGAGIRQAGALKAFHACIDAFGIPVLTSRLGMDLMDHQHPLFVGRPGTYGDRAANFTIQNADLLLSIGCRLGIGLVGYQYDDFARHATIISVDIDPKELSKPSVVPDIAVQADAGSFLTALRGSLPDFRFSHDAWVKKTQWWKGHYPVDLPEYLEESNGVNSYHLMRVLSDFARNDDTFVVDTGSCFHAFAQAFQVKFGQRHIITGGLSTMGYMPAAVGVAAAAKGKQVFCITGDGSLQLNLQELQTIVHHKLPVKLIMLNNNGYQLIRITQKNFQGGRLIGVDPESGLTCPDMGKIASAYGLAFLRIATTAELHEGLQQVVDHQGPILCEVVVPPDQLLMPRVASKLVDGKMASMPYDDMFPFLSRQEYVENCVRETIL